MYFDRSEAVQLEICNYIFSVRVRHAYVIPVSSALSRYGLRFLAAILALKTNSSSSMMMVVVVVILCPKAGSFTLLRHLGMR